MKNLFLCLCLTTTLGSCIKDGSSAINVDIQNTTTHIVAINPYNQGLLINEKSFQLNYNENKVIETQNNLGKDKGPTHFNDYFVDVDSIQIVWDNQFIITHMIADSFISTGKYVSFSDSHNLGKVSNYVQKVASETKHSISFKMTYYFTEQDYLDAKE